MSNQKITDVASAQAADIRSQQTTYNPFTSNAIDTSRYRCTPLWQAYLSGKSNVKVTCT